MASEGLAAREILFVDDGVPCDMELVSVIQRPLIGKPTAGRAGRPRKFYSMEPAGARALMDAYSTIQALAGGLISRLANLAEG